MTAFAIYTCGNCGTPVSKGTTSCPHCHALLTAIRCTACKHVGPREEFVNDQCPNCGTAIVVAAPPAARPVRRQRRPGEKLPAAYVLASFVVPGLGSFLAGRRGRGLLIFGLSVVALIGVTLGVDAIVGHPTGTGGLLAIPLWIWGMVDAGLAAQQWNREHLGPLPEAGPPPAAVAAPPPAPVAAPPAAAPAAAPPAAAPASPPGGSWEALVGRLSAELVEIGRREGYVGNPDGVYDEHWNHRRARQIGAELNDLGGMQLMLEVHGRIAEQFPMSARARELEACWGGVGSWRG